MRIVGNTKIKSQIHIAMRSAYQQNRSLPHMLLSGAAGCGKTTMAKYIASLTNAKFLNVAYDSIKQRSDVLDLIQHLDYTGYDQYGRKKGSEDEHINATIVFIDEIHGLTLAAQEYLGILMEEWKIPIKKKEAKIDVRLGLQSQNVVRWCPQFTLVGATTNDGKLSKPFRDRFKLRFVFSPYDAKDSAEIVREHARRLNIEIEEGAVEEVAKRGRGVARILVSLLERCRDTMLAFQKSVLTKELAQVVFYELGIDENGLTKTDINLLLFLHTTESPIGLENLAIHLNESPKVLSETIEPYLIQSGFLLRSGRGRTITNEGKKYLLMNGHLSDVVEHKRYDIPSSFDRRL